MISSSLLCWLPYCIVSVRAEFLPFHEISISVSAMAVCLAKSSSLINPLLYVILNPRIRRAVVLIVQWRRGEPNRLNQSHWKNDESQTIPMTVRRPLEPRPALVEWGRRKNCWPTFVHGYFYDVSFSGSCETYWCDSLFNNSSSHG